MKIFRQIFENYSNVKFHENPYEWTDITKLYINYQLDALIIIYS